jgi:hypothetical protein
MFSAMIIYSTFRLYQGFEVFGVPFCLSLACSIAFLQSYDQQYAPSAKVMKADLVRTPVHNPDSLRFGGPKQSPRPRGSPI